MTFGEKLKDARKTSGLSQEQLAEKLSVSRSAVAKWESDKGLPDVDNLKAMAQLLDVSLDYLLADDERISFNETKEPIDLDSFEKTGKCRSKKDAACLSRYHDADAIWPLIRTKKMNRLEWLADFVTQPGIVQILDYIDNPDAYYLVERSGRQILVRISKEFITSSDLTSRIDPKKFVIGNYVFRKTAYQLI